VLDRLSSLTNTPVTNTGSQIRITELMPGDIATVRSVFEGLSPRSRYLRFHAARSHLPSPVQRRLADIRPGSHEAFVAVLGDRPIGIARWIRDAADPRNAEVAIEVIDAAQSRGIGHQLAAHAARSARSARSAGVRFFLAYIDEVRQDLRARTVACGATVDPCDPSLLRLPVRSLLDALEKPSAAEVSGRRDIAGYNGDVLPCRSVH